MSSSSKKTSSKKILYVGGVILVVFIVVMGLIMYYGYQDAVRHYLEDESIQDMYASAHAYAMDDRIYFLLPACIIISVVWCALIYIIYVIHKSVMKHTEAKRKEIEALKRKSSIWYEVDNKGIWAWAAWFVNDEALVINGEEIYILSKIDSVGFSAPDKHNIKAGIITYKYDGEIKQVMFSYRDTEVARSAFEKMRKECKETKNTERKAKIQAMRSEIIQFVNKNTNDKNVARLYEEMDRAYNTALRKFLVGKTCAPAVPTYTRGVVRGSLADNISILANAQKKAIYDSQMAGIQDTLGGAYISSGEVSSVGYRIEHILRDIPNSEKYIKMNCEIVQDMKCTLNEIANM